MSRADIPFYRSGENAKLLKAYHVVGFRRHALERFVQLPQTPMELAESVEFLRILEHGHVMHAKEVAQCARSVDTHRDLDVVRAAYEADDVVKIYL